MVLPSLEEPVRGSAVGIDLWALDAAQSFRSPVFDVLGSIIGLFGQAEVTIGVAFGLAVARARRSPRAGIVPLLILAVIAIEAALKLTVPHPAPPFERSRTVELIPFVHASFAGSFPSGHVARLTFLAGIVRGVPLWLRAGAVLLMILSRLYLAEHWLSDCLGGLVLGYLVSAVAQALEARILRRSTHIGEPSPTYSLGATDDSAQEGR